MQEKTPEEIKNEEREKVNREFEEERSKNMREESLSNEIKSGYKKMEDKLKQGLVDPEEYLKHEKIDLTSEQMADIPRDSKSFQQLWTSKVSLTKVRKKAQFNKKRIDALKTMTDKNIDYLNVDRIESELPRELIHEYRKRIYQSNPEYQA